ncbi:hypothetical protein HYT56_03995 [Candidatus Woesearchaeota archaeon]|nr:hypothetical protein [Candidatus Woesearchaeota archaeon]
MKNCGFHALCDFWYNGFTTFLLYPPGWMFFTYPLYLLTGNVQVSTYLSLISMFALSFIFIWIIGMKNSFNKVERIAFFLFYFVNAINIGNFIRLGRVTELFAWTLFLAFAGLILWYKDNRINKKFILVPIIFGIIILSHQTTTIISSIFFISLFLIKKQKEKLLIIGSFLFSLLISSFWLIPYLINVGKSATFNYSFSRWLLGFSGRFLVDNIVSAILSLILWVTFYFYLKSYNNRRNNIVFFLPIFILNFIFVTRFIIFIPILKNIAPDSYLMLFMFLSIYFFFKTDFKIYNVFVKRLIFFGVLIFAIINVVVSSIYTSFFPEYTSYDYETIELLLEVDGMLAILNHPTSYVKAYYSFIPIKYKIPVVGGWSDATISQEYNLKWKSLQDTLEEMNCEQLNRDLKELNVVNVITYNDYCKTLNECGLEEIKVAGKSCLLKFS